MEDKSIQDLSRENLSRLSSEFEVELLRLIKTLNLISQSRELYKNQVEQIESLSSSLKIRINDFTIRLLEIEKAARESVREQRTSSFSTPGEGGDGTDYETIIREVNEFREKIDAVDKDIEKAKLEHLSKLDSFYTVYNLELKASQGELDTKLTDLKEILSEAAPAAVPTPPEPAPEPEIKAAPEPQPAQTNGSGAEPRQEAPPESTPPAAHVSDQEQLKDTDIPKRHINLSKQKANGSPAHSSNGVLMGIIFIFFGALVGVSSFYLLDYISQDNIPTSDTQQIYSDVEAPREQEFAAKNIEQQIPVQEKEVLSQPEQIVAVNKPAAPEEPTIEEQNNNQIAFMKDKPAEQESSELTQENLQEILETAPDLEIYTVSGVGANVRNGPGINHEVATVVLEGDLFSGLGEKRGIWIKILTPDGTEGWISRKVVEKIN